MYDGRRVLLPRTDHVERTLALILGRRPVPDDPASTSLVDQLDRHGCLVWPTPPRVARPEVALLGRIEGVSLPEVGVLLDAAGVGLATSPAGADVVMVLSAGEIDRDRLDPLVRDRTDHVVVRLVDGGAVLGPFVVPGVTACLRCIDAHLSVEDPDHLAVTTRYARATARPRADGTPDLEPVLVSLALTWVLRDALAHLAGREPSTWSRTLFLGAQPRLRSEQEWPRHPRCGCFW